ncbi:hypothetical protein G6K86_32730 [Agrobacterium rhizogenes]|nr:hypothetical protein [Rhizobium rhizogenes]
MGWHKLSEKVESAATLEFQAELRLGTLVVRIKSNIPDFRVLERFSQAARLEGKNTAHVELWCVSVERARLSELWLQTHTREHELCDSRGAPVRMAEEGTTHFVFGSDHLEGIVWSFYLRYFLSLHAMESDALHLKAAAVSFQDATLLLGAGGTGKTVLLAHLCGAGARFVTNTHALIKDGQITGVATCMRVRPSAAMTPLVEQAAMAIGHKTGEVNVDPMRLFRLATGGERIKNVCVVNFTEPGCASIEELSIRDLQHYAEEFALPINTYKLEDDLFAFMRRDPRRFAAAYAGMKGRLGEVVANSRRYLLNVDVTRPENLLKVVSLLSDN